MTAKKPLPDLPLLTDEERATLIDVLEAIYPDYHKTALEEAQGSDRATVKKEGALIDSAVSKLMGSFSPPEPREDRAKRASDALDAINDADLYEDRKQAGDEQFITDLLSDLMHLCYSVDGTSFAGLVSSAQAHFEAELRRDDDDEEGDGQ